MSEDLTNKLPGNGSQTLVTVVQELTVRVEKLDQKVEERLYDTRPMWEQVVKNVQQLHEGQVRIEHNQAQLQETQHRMQQTQERVREDQERVQDGLQSVQEVLEHLRHDSRDLGTFLRDILRRMSIFNDTLVAIQADYRDIYDRVRGLELKAEMNGQCDL